MSALQIPDAAIHACALAIDPDEDISDLTPEDVTEIRGALAASAPHIVAAELRSWADRLHVAILAGEASLVLVEILAHADDLDGGARP